MRKRARRWSAIAAVSCVIACAPAARERPSTHAEPAASVPERPQANVNQGPPAPGAATPIVENTPAQAAAPTNESPRPAFDVFSSYYGDELVETQHHVELTLHRGYASLVVRREVYNPGARHEQGTWLLHVPNGAIATRLRTLGRRDGKPIWFEGELLDAELALHRYNELTGVGAYDPRDPALLEWAGTGALRLNVFPVFPLRAYSVEYTLQVPTEYYAGAHHLVLPTLGLEGAPPIVTLRVAEPRDRLSVDGVQVNPGFTFRPGSDAASLALVPDGFAPARAASLDGAMARHVIAPNVILSRVWAAAAPQLAPLPEQAHVVLVLDASRSLSASRVNAAHAVAVSYLEQLPRDARVEVLSFDRAVRAHHGAFVERGIALDALRAHAPVLGNGSHLDRALEHARGLFVGLPAGVTKRVVVLSDTLMRSGLSGAALGARVRGTGALVHGVIAETSSGSATLRRWDEDPWAPLLAPTGGLFWHASAQAEPDGSAANKQTTQPPNSDPATDHTFLELVRPVRIDHVTVNGVPLAESRFGAQQGDSSIAEGEGVESFEIVTQTPEVEKFHGVLWTRVVERTLRPLDEQNRLWSALAFGAELTSALSDEQRLQLAKYAGAVTPLTSYLAIEPGVRPSTEGLDHENSGFGAGHGRLGGSHRTRAPKVRVEADYRGALERALAPVWQRCGGQPGNAELTLETTFREIVDVLGVTVRAPGTALPPAQRDCVIEGAWALELDDSFAGLPRATHVIAL